MKILFAAIGSAGDVYPLIGIAVELQRKGAKVLFVTNKEHVYAVIGAGIRFVGGWTIEDDVRDRLSAPNNPDMTKQFMTDVVVGWLPEDASMICTRALAFGGVDTIVCNQFCWAARITANRLGVPVISCVVSPAFFRKVIHLADDEVKAYADKALQAVRYVSEVNDEVPDWMTGQQALELCHRSDLELLLFDETMLTVGGKTTFFHREVSWRGATPQLVGPCWSSAVGQVSHPAGFAVSQFSNQRKKLCVISFGDWVHGNHRMAIAEPCIEAVLENPDWIVLYLGRGRPSEREEVLCLPFYPLSLLHADLAITHAGIGTCYQLLANQIPAVHIPFCADQYDNALWMSENRGDVIVRYEDVTVENIQTAMNIALAEPGTPAKVPVTNNSGKAAATIQSWLETASVTF